MIASSDAPVYHGGRLIGTIRRGELQQTRRPDAFLRWGIAFDLAVLAEAERAGADRVRVRNSETGEIYTASIAAIRKLGKPINHGYGQQIALAYGHWNCNEPVTPHPTQASLFDLAVTP